MASLNDVVVPEGVRRVRVDRVLADLLPDVSRSTVQRWLAQGRVTLKGRVCRAKDAVSSGAVLSVDPSAPPPSRAEPDGSVQFEVLFEDDHLIVVSKPPGLVVHPGRGHQSGTLVNGLLARNSFGRPPADERDPEGPQRPGIVHRIDKDTSGILVVAKEGVTREGLKAQFAARTIGRKYTAITDGVPTEGVIETIHRRHPTQRLKFTSIGDAGKRAATAVRVLRVLPFGVALVECRLQTGRTHQIRVHLSERSRTPIICDALYGRRLQKPLLLQAAEELGRQALHAGFLQFTHPVSLETMRFDAPLPNDMQGFIRVASGLGCDA